MPKENEVPNCNEHGVLGIIPGIIGNLQALETIKALTGIGEVLSGKLLLFNGLDQSYQKMKFKVRPENLDITKLQDFYEWNNPCKITPTVEAIEIEKLLLEKAQIVDVRTIEEYENYHLPNTIHIPLRWNKPVFSYMLLSIPEFVILLLGFFSIATLYSSVGFGGGSSYLAILTLFFVSFFTIRSVALLCNLIVVSSSTYHYWKNGHLTIKKFLPFIVTSIPFAFIGARFRLSEQLFFVILSIALIISALALIYQTTKLKKSEEVSVHYPLYLNYVLGAAIGFLSGLVGIGGGIFLAPILHYMKWDKSIKIAALASFFILINSISGIAGLPAFLF